VRRVLVICPTSLKSQWRAEIEPLRKRDVHLVAGKAEERALALSSITFFAYLSLAIRSSRGRICFVSLTLRAACGWLGRGSGVSRSMLTNLAAMPTG